MFKNHFIVTLRNLLRHPFYSFINIFGLAIGMAAGFMILQYVYFELTYDSFFQNKQNIYRVQLDRYAKGELATQWAAGCAGAGFHMKEDFPEVVEFVNLHSSQAQISYDNVYYEPESPYYAGETFFEVFSIPLLRGIDSLVLKEPFTVALSETLAKKIFGDEDPMGKRLKQNDSRDFLVTGVYQDFPERSHMNFDLLYSFKTYIDYTGPEAETAWQWDGFLNYVVLRDGTDPKDLEAKFPDFVQARQGEELERFDADMIYHLQPLTKIHLISDYIGEIKPTGDQASTYFLLIIGTFVLFIAWINYINLTTARSMSRAREVGIRKVMGSHKAQLIRQFMFESFSINLIAFVIAAVFVLAAFPFFNDFVGRAVPYSWPDANFFWWGLIGVFVVGLFLSGFYPALVLSKFKPVVVLKGQFSGSPSGNLLRKGLVVFQFIASIILITGTFVVYKQMNFLQSQDLGMKIDQNMIIKTPSFASDSIYENRNQVFQNELTSLPEVEIFTSSTAVPGREAGWNAGGIRLINETEAASNQYRVIGCDDRYMDLFHIELIAGRKFDRSFQSEESNVIFSEKAMIQLGFNDPEEILNQKIYFWGDTFNVIGVTKNYRQESPKKSFDELIFRYFPSSNGMYTLNIKTGNMKGTVTKIEEAWERSFGAKPMNHRFQDDYYNEQYESEVKFGSIFGMFAILAMIVAGLGLFGLASYITSLRSKEVGVRKVLGASLNQLLVLLTSDFMKLVGIAIIVSVPISLWAMNSWLQGFASRINLGVFTFLIPAVVLMVIAIATVSYHTFRTARLDPASTLRDE